MRLTLLLLLAVPLAGAVPADRAARLEELLDVGRPMEADSLYATGAPASRHRREIFEARLAATQGNWKKTDARLRAWKNSPERGEGSAEVLFWLGWSALHQGKRPEADSLFLLASAYTEEPVSDRAPGARGAQEALEYRFAALLDPSPVLIDYLRGLPESPLPDSMRLAALGRIPPASPLYPYARWQTGLLLEVLGDTARARATLAALAEKPGSLPARKAAARLHYLQEQTGPDSARTGYEGLLMRQQQGVSAEFVRKRLQNMR